MTSFCFSSCQPKNLIRPGIHVCKGLAASRDASRTRTAVESRKERMIIESRTHSITAGNDLPAQTTHVTAKSVMRPGSIVFSQHAIESDGEPFRLLHGLQNTRRGTEGVT
jgi:hypothetical protein